MKPPWHEHAQWQNPITSVRSTGDSLATLNLDPHPGSIGGRIVGTITLPQDTTNEGSFTLRLSCVSNPAPDQNDYPDDRVEILWTQEIQTTPGSTRNGMKLAFAFDQVPSNLPESEMPLGGRFVEWQLLLTATKLCHTFLIPVFETDLYGEGPTISASETEKLLSKWHTRNTWQPYRTDVSLEADTLVVRHGPWRGGFFQAGGIKGFFTVLILLVLSVTLLVFGNDQLVVKSVTGILGALGLFVTALAAYLWVRTVEIRAQPGQLSRICHLFGRTIQTKALSGDKIVSFIVRDNVLYVDSEELDNVLELIDSIYERGLLGELRRLLVDAIKPASSKA